MAKKNFFWPVTTDQGFVALAMLPTLTCAVIPGHADGTAGI